MIHAPILPKSIGKLAILFRLVKPESIAIAGIAPDFAVLHFTRREAL
jgi:hypothetical protein